jgi:antirestriction protein ArdC
LTDPPPETSRGRAEARREEARARFEAACEDLRSSEGWQRFARARALLRGYSLTNTLLILSQRSDATTVASYRRWIALGRQVRRGEQALRIWAPSVRRERDEATGEETAAVRRFVLVPVFDISQTEGPPLPEPPPIAPLTGASHAHLLHPLEEDAARAGYRVERHDVMPGRSQGYVDHHHHLIALASTLAPNGQVAVLVHELAHVHGARYDELGRAGAEVVAETAAHIALAGVGLDTGRQSLPYVAGWADAAPKTLAAYAEATHRIAAALESALGMEREHPERWVGSLRADAHVAQGPQITDQRTRAAVRAL